MKSGKLLKIENDRSIYLQEFGEGLYVSPEGEIAYRNIGPNYDIRIVETSPILVTAGVVNVLNAEGKPKFHFPESWLDTDRMKLYTLIEKGLVKTGT